MKLDLDDLIFRAAIETSGDGFVVVDLDGNIRAVNDSLCRMTGFSREELLQSKVFNLAAEFNPDELAGRIEKLKLGGVDHIETLVRRKDGSVFLSERSSSYHAIHGGLFFSFVRDINARKQAEEALRKTNERLELAQSAAGSAVWDWDIKAGRFDWSQELFRLFGLDSTKDLAGFEIWNSILHPEDREAAAESIKTAARDGAQFDSEYRIVRRSDGAVRWINALGRATYDDSRQPLRMMGICIDITERKQTEAALQQSEANLQAMLDNLPYLAWLKDPEGRYIKVNKAFVDYLRLDDPRQVTGKTDLDFQPKELAEKYRADDAEVIASLKQKHVEESAFDGANTHWVEAFKSPVTDKQGHVLGTVGFARDITSRKLAEEVLHKANERLELAQSAAGFGVWDWDITTNRFEWTQELFKLFGLDPEKDLPGYESLQSVLHPEDRETAAKRLQIVMQDDVPLDWVYRIVRRDNGEMRWIHFMGRTLFDESRRPLRMTGICIDITKQKTAEAEIHNLAFFDHLTNLPNRRLLLDRIRQCMATGARHISYQALLFLDLDDFKIVNDSFGHDVGDQILAESASRLQSCIRADDTVSRLGGDEFVALLIDLSDDIDEAATQAKSVAEKILYRFREPYRLEKHLHHVTTSIGITLFRGRDVPPDEILQRADLAMYQAKAAGRNTLRFFDPEMQASITARCTMERELRRAISENELVLHAQPQVDAKGRCTGVEVLIRWKNPNRGLVLPAEFIPLAEETGLILPIGAWVLKEACHQLVAWQQNPATAHLSIAVNVSPKQFRLPNFVEEIHSLIQQHGVTPALLKLEITESMLLEDVENVIIKMSALKGIGVSFSLDDFGTGYSSLSYLKRLPLDQVKIDRSFVRDVLIDPNDAAICRAIIALGNSLGLGIIAEGVETVSQWNFLKSEGCGHAQGFLFAKPMPFDELQEYIKANSPTCL